MEGIDRGATIAGQQDWLVGRGHGKLSHALCPVLAGESRSNDKPLA